jgi:hypothetical protein
LITDLLAMKVTVERAELLRSLGHVHRVVERRNTIPILANVLLHADHSKLALKATDLDVEVTDTIAAEVGPGGSTTVPALNHPATAPRWQSAPAVRASRSRHCRRAISPISRPAK